MVELAPSTSSRVEGCGSPDGHLYYVLEALPVALMRVDQVGTLLAVNQAGLSLLGVSSLPEVLGTTPLLFLPDAAHPACASLLAAAVEGQSGSLTVDLSGSDAQRVLELHAVVHPAQRTGSDPR